jgi:apolipoprotein N-acyltransferase
VPEAAVLRVRPGTRIETPLSRLAHRLATATSWRRYALGVLLGVLLAGAMPPVDLSPLIFVAFTGLLWLDDGSLGAWASFRLGYAFGLGFFTAGLYWIAIALFVDISAYWWALPFAVLGVPAFLALFPAAAMGIVGLVARRLGLGGVARVCLFAVVWSAVEWLRGHVLTGLPWNLPGYAWSGGFPGAIAVLQSTAWIGIYGLSFLTTLAGALPALFGEPTLVRQSALQRFWPAIAAALLLLVPACAGAIRLAMAPIDLTDIELRLVQPAIAESLKWDPAAAEANLRRLTELSAQPTGHPLAAVLWPEGAVPFLLERDAVHRAAIAAAAPPGGYVITGGLHGEPATGQPTSFYNSIEAIDPTGAIRAVYDKAHLVPFGEYMPLRSLLPFDSFIPGPADLGAGPGPRTIALAGLPPFSPVICYEAIFPGMVIDRRDRPEWILNVTNDAWYGRSSGPYQHFAIARTRAIEEGLPLVRVANNGISGVVDPEGRVLAHTRLDSVGYADVALPAARAPTLYAQAGDWIFAAFLIIGLGPLLARRDPAG